MTTLASSIISKAKILATDPDSVRWGDVEWLGWLTLSERDVVTVRRAAYAKTRSVPLVAGSRQALPADGIEFIEYIRAMGADGLTPGPAGRQIERRVLDASNPNWHAATKTAAPAHCIYDPVDPLTFYVYPPSTGGVFAEVLHSVVPPEITSLAQPINLSDMYAGPLLNCVMSKAFAKDSDNASNAALSMFYRKAFESDMGMKQQADAAVAEINSKRG